MQTNSKHRRDVLSNWRYLTCCRKGSWRANRKSDPKFSVAKSYREAGMASHQEKFAVGTAHRYVDCLISLPVWGHVQAETGYHLAAIQALYERAGLVT